MNPRDEAAFEAELRRLKPAPTPEALQAKLAVARPEPVRPRAPQRPRASWGLVRWLAPLAAAAALVVLLIDHSPRPQVDAVPSTRTALAPPTFKADDVVIDQRFVAAYDAVARLPDGAPIRFRCREWTDEVILRDSSSGVIIERRTPRIEVMPVSFETD